MSNGNLSEALIRFHNTILSYHQHDVKQLTSLLKDYLKVMQVLGCLAFLNFYCLYPYFVLTIWLWIWLAWTGLCGLGGGVLFYCVRSSRRSLLLIQAKIKREQEKQRGQF